MVKERQEIEQEYKWDLTQVFNSEEEWQKKYEEVRSEIEQIDDHRGELTESAENLLKALKAKDELMRDIAELSAYARMKTHEDMRNQDAQELKSKADSLQSAAAAKVAFYQPEIKQLSEEQVEEFIQQESELEDYRQYLDNILRMKEHILDTETESMLNELGDVFSTPEETYSMLTNADLSFPEIKHDGEKIHLTASNLTKLLKKKDRELREKVYNQFYGRLGEFRNTITTMMDKEVKKNVKLSRIRGHDSARKSSLKNSNIPVSVYDNLVDTVEDNLHAGD